MNKSNHKKITVEALCGKGFNSKAVAFIAAANQDSDHLSGPAKNGKQHFCGEGKSKDEPHIVRRRCVNFVRRSLDNAAMLARLGHKQGAIDALYFIGRAFHCIQDFYAHSNWVALGKNTRWPSSANALGDSRLKFCTATPGFGMDWKKLKLNWGPITNMATYKSNVMSDSLEGKGLYAKLKEPWRKPEDGISHPLMHLDCGGCIADRVISWYGKVGGGGAYQRAHNLARDHTDYYLKIFESKLKQQKNHPQSSENQWSEKEKNLPSFWKNRYKAAKVDTSLFEAGKALAQLKNIDPSEYFYMDDQIIQSRELFHYVMGVASSPKPKSGFLGIYNITDLVFGPRSLVG